MSSASNSIARILQSTVTDFFKQAALDYLLGANLNAFQEFAERLETSDPGEIVRVAAIRQEALETASNEVLVEGETKVAAWNLLSPSEIDVVRPRKGGKYEEKILLLSQKATYVVSYDYTLQKVSFARVSAAVLTSSNASLETAVPPRRSQVSSEYQTVTLSASKSGRISYLPSTRAGATPSRTMGSCCAIALRTRPNTSGPTRSGQLR